MTLHDDVASALRPLLAKGKSTEIMNDLLSRVLRIHPEPVVELPAFNLVIQAEIDPAAYNMLAENEAYAVQGRSELLGDGDPIEAIVNLD